MDGNPQRFPKAGPTEEPWKQSGPAHLQVLAAAPGTPLALGVLDFLQLKLKRQSDSCFSKDKP